MVECLSGGIFTMPYLSLPISYFPCKYEGCSEVDLICIKINSEISLKTKPGV